MRIHLLSDLHLDHDARNSGTAEGSRPTFRTSPAAIDADVVVVAGDVWEPSKAHPTRAMTWLADSYPGRPLIYVPGNHCFYKRSLDTHLDALREAASQAGVHLLDGDQVNIGGVRFLGATLWTDFAVLGDAAAGIVEARRVMRDYKKIRMGNSSAPFTPNIAAAIHARQVAWLTDALKRPWAGKTVVVTHHAPSLRSVRPDLRAKPEVVAYASDLEQLMLDHGQDLWLHGHTHHACDYRVGRTRVVSNPLGYTREPVPGFDPDLIVEA
jgi:3',5'-cyclic AMP phosphodiesterase CpdA